MEQRICRKCLLAEADRGMYETVLREIGRMKPEMRADESLYSRRLAICRECDRLSGGTCLACGCYVELRAAAVSSACPKKKWQ